jgi:hypothetical protein
MALRSERPYERLNIAGVTGITEAQRASLKNLGASEKEEGTKQGFSEARATQQGF